MHIPRKAGTCIICRIKCQHRPIFPGRLQPSIVGTDELNCRVRNGNGWTLAVKDTDCTGRVVNASAVYCRDRYAARKHRVPNARRRLKVNRRLSSFEIVQALGLLVSVSSTRYRAYTPDLSNL